MTGYDAGIRRERVTIYNRTAASVGDWGSDSDGITWQVAGTVWAFVDWQKGKRAMAEGSLDVYAVILVRMNWNSFTTSRSRMTYNGQNYCILPDTFHPNKHANTIQFHAQLVVDDIVEATVVPNEEDNTSESENEVTS